MPERLTAPWTIEDTKESFAVKTADGFSLTWVHYNYQPPGVTVGERLTKDQARKLATAISRIPARQWPADVKAALEGLRENCSPEHPDFESFVHWFVRDALIGCGALKLGPENRGRGAKASTARGA